MLAKTMRLGSSTAQISLAYSSFDDFSRNVNMTWRLSMTPMVNEVEG